jgi:hypothetical protein
MNEVGERDRSRQVSYLRFPRDIIKQSWLKDEGEAFLFDAINY